MLIRIIAACFVVIFSTAAPAAVVFKNNTGGAVDDFHMVFQRGVSKDLTSTPWGDGTPTDALRNEWKFAGSSIGIGGMLTIDNLDTSELKAGSLFLVEAYWTVGGDQVGDEVSPVVEPASWTMMIAGFGLTGWVLRRRRTDVRLAPA